MTRSSDALSCGTDPSPVAVTSSSHWCGANGAGAFACAADTDGAHLVCATDPWAKRATRFAVDGSLPRTAKPANPMPLGIELADGSRWLYRSGGAMPPGPRDSVVKYECQRGCTDHEALLSAPSAADDSGLTKEGTVWYARRGPIGYDLPKTAAVTKARVATAYFLHAVAPSAASSGSSGSLGPVTSPNVEIAKPADARQLPDTHGLRAFARGQLAQALKDSPGCPMTITVQKLDAQSSAFVSEFGSGCGGGVAIWGVKGGRWKRVFSGQYAPTCAELRSSGATLNPDVVGDCIGPAPAYERRRYTP